MKNALLQGLVNGLAISILAISPIIYREAHEVSQHTRCGKPCPVFYLEMK